MANDDEGHRSDSSKERLFGEVARRAERKLRARREEEKSAWFWMGMFGLVGWAVAIPTLAGIALGMWLDKRWPGEFSWTLSLLVAGIVFGCFNAWYWVKQESAHDGNRSN